MTSLEKTLAALARFFRTEKIPYMVIGGAANLFWGNPRTTLDVDVTIQVAEKDYGHLLEKIKPHFTLRVKDPLKFIAKTNVLLLEDKGGVRIDLIFARLPYEYEAIKRAKRRKVLNIDVRICAPEDLILHKVISDRPKDQGDVLGIIEKMKDALDRKYLDPKVKELAIELSKPNILKFYLQCFKK